MTLTRSLIIYLFIITRALCSCVIKNVECKKFVQHRHRKITNNQYQHNEQNMRTPLPSITNNDQDLRIPISYPSTVGEEFIIKNDQKMRTSAPTMSLPPSISPSFSKNISKLHNT